MKNYLKNVTKMLGGMGKKCYLCMLFLPVSGHGAECVEVSEN